MARGEKLFGFGVLGGVTVLNYSFVAIIQYFTNYIVTFNYAEADHNHQFFSVFWTANVTVCWHGESAWFCLRQHATVRHDFWLGWHSTGISNVSVTRVPSPDPGWWWLGWTT